jgi:general nucleoside transport system ATP-binding protein
VSDPFVRLQGIVKTFPGVVANVGIDLAIFPGEVVALLGENGAGKSTLMSILAGLYRPDEGTIFFGEESVELRSPRDAINRGIGMVHQQFRLIDSLTVAENVLLGWREPRFLLDMRSSIARVRRLAALYGLEVDPAASIWQLSVGERQRVEILKMLYREARILILDEPTAILTPPEVDQLFRAVHRIRSEERAVVFITHKLDEVRAIADRIVVLRAGRVVGQASPQASARELAQMMVGHDIPAPPKRHLPPGALVLDAHGLSVHGDRGPLAVRDVSLQLRRGEILGIAGVAGNGQRELLEAIAGLRSPAAGRISFNATDIASLTVRERWVRGLAYIPEDRLGQGLVGSFTVTENAVLRDYDRPPISHGPIFNWAAARQRAEEIVNTFHVRSAGLQVPVRHLSGGNQQRLLFGREALTAPVVLLAMHPTRGLDVEATTTVHRLLLDLSVAGTAILLVSESLDELLAVSDRVAVMHRGRIVGVHPTTEVSRADIGLLMTGSAPS